MRNLQRMACLAVTAITPMLSGCFLFYTTRHLPVPKAPSITQTVTPDQLVQRLNERWEAINTMTAKVEIQASVLRTEKGVATDYTTIGGNILFSKPESLRVLGRAPVVGLKMFDMVSDGKNFTLYVPSKNIAYKGSNRITKRSPNQLENLRPDFFLDALIVRGLEPDDYYSVTTDSETVEDTSKKHLYFVPEYILSITRHTPGSRRDIPVRVITFRRDDLLPYEQDMYDQDGNPETHVIYANYQDFGSGQYYPSIVTIKRPQENSQIVLTMEAVTKNVHLPPEQFVVEIPPATQIKHLD
jgi:outer membrane lipoprotein-sorting protein